MEVSYQATNELSITERAVVSLCETINEKPLPKRLQRVFHDHLGRHVIRVISSNLLEVQGIEHAIGLNPESGVILCSNHRSFFDMYMVTSVLRNQKVSWCRDTSFPVRSNFFYDQWKGLAVNLAMSGGAMYPPIFRDRNNSGLNHISVNRIIQLLEKSGSVVGMHPEGTRGKGVDPYAVLPAKPGVGQMALRSKAPVLPIWVSGMSNDLGRQVVSNFRKGRSKGSAVRVTFGAPMTFEDMYDEDFSDREVQLRAANRIMDVISGMGQEERTRLLNQGSLS